MTPAAGGVTLTGGTLVVVLVGVVVVLVATVLVVVVGILRVVVWITIVTAKSV